MKLNHLKLVMQFMPSYPELVVAYATLFGLPLMEQSYPIPKEPEETVKVKQEVRAIIPQDNGYLMLKPLTLRVCEERKEYQVTKLHK